VVGLNEVTGQLINCSFRGAVTGEHYVGGIAGQNLGSLIQCVNNGSVNTTEIDVEASLLDLDLTSYRLNSTENIPAGTDIGGVVGFSAGVMQNCRNTGDVGYEHMGYNVGGIVGRHSGYLDGCVNRGTVRGRKDVGGIAGQLEPQVTLKYGGDTLSQLWDELDALESLMDRTLTDADGVSGSVLDRMNNLTDSVGAAKDTTVDLSDAMTDWANANIDQVNDASARLSWVLGQMEPVMDDISDALKQAKTAVSQFADALDELEDAGELGSDAAAQLRLAMEDLRTASQKGGDAFACIRSAMTHLQNSLGDREKIEQALEELSGGLSDLSGAFSEIAAAVVRISAALDKAEEWAETAPAWTQLRQGITELGSALQEISAAIEDVRSAVRRILQLDATGENLALLSAAVGRLGAAVTDLSRACSDFAAALDAFSTGDTEDVQSQLDQGMEELERAGGEIATAGEQLASVVKNVAAGLAELPAALRDLKNGLVRLDDGIAAADAAAEKIGSAVEQLRQSDVAQETIDALQTERRNISKALEDARNAADRIDAALTALKNELDPSEAEAAWQDLQSAADAAEDCARALDRAGGHLEQV
ncbi:MAG: hypothetical protein J6J81_02580, partial [Oscillospiraceae bacterium]|nr:hypothetical protein [Oscillospiraceae bacterium]